MPLDHFSIAVPLNRMDQIASWLVAAGQHMGFKEILRPVPYVVGLGEDRPYLWLIGDKDMEETPQLQRHWRMQHVCFLASNVEEVKQWHAAALKAGGEDNGAPGPRPEYTPNYYGAFVRDPVCGINFEAVSYHVTKDARSPAANLEQRASTDSATS